MASFNPDGTPVTPEQQLTPPAPAMTAGAADGPQHAAPNPTPAPQEQEPPVQGEVVQQGTEAAVVERFDAEKTESWPYDWMEFKGDRLGVRLPTMQALAAFSLSTSKYVPAGQRNDLTGLFIARHLSPESYARVFSRLMDADDPDYDVDTVGDLFNAVVTAAVKRHEGKDTDTTQ